MKKLLNNSIFYIMSIIFLILFIFILKSGINNSYIYQNIYKMYFVMIVVSIILIATILNLFRLKFVENKILYYVFITVILIINIFFAIKYSKIIVPVSDFLSAYQKAISFNIDKGYDVYYPWWTNYSLLLKGLFSVFGKSLNVVYICNIILSFLSSLLIFKILTKHFQINKTLSYIITLIFVLYPSRLMFLPFVFPDFIAELGFILASYFFFNNIDKIKNEEKSYYLPLLIAFIIAFTSLIKPVQEIFFVLFFIILFVLLLDNFKKYYKNIIVFFSIFLVSSIVFTTGFNLFYTKITHIKLNKKLIISNKLFVGLNSVGKGYWNPYNSEYVHSLEIKYNYDANKIANKLTETLIKDIKEHKKDLKNLLIDKLKVGFGNDYSGLEWVSLSKKDQTNQDKKYNSKISKSNLYYYIVLAFSLISIYGLIKTKNIKQLYFVIFIIGFVFVILIGESQSRYKLSFLFNFIILAGLAINYIYQYDLISRIKKFIGEN